MRGSGVAGQIRSFSILAKNHVNILKETNRMHTQIRQYCILMIFAFFSFATLNMALAESTAVTSSGIKFSDGTTQTTAASGGDSLWSQSGSYIYYNNGNVGIGTTSPGTLLDVMKSNLGVANIIRVWNLENENAASDAVLRAVAGNAARAWVQFGDTAAARASISSGTADDLQFRINGSSLKEAMRITNSGNVGIGTTSPGYPLEMASGAHVTTGGVWTDASSRDYKENIRDLTYDEARLALSSLNPSKFNYKLDKEDEYLGFIAEDVPDLVATKDRKGLSPMDIVAVLTKVLQKQQEEIETLKNLLATKQ